MKYSGYSGCGNAFTWSYVPYIHVSKKLTLFFLWLMPADKDKTWWSSLKVDISLHVYLHVFLSKHLIWAYSHINIYSFHIPSAVIDKDSYYAIISYLFWLHCNVYVAMNLSMNLSWHHWGHHTYDAKDYKQEYNKLKVLLNICINSPVLS